VTGVRTIEIFADTRGKAICRGCGQPIEWAEIVKSGKKMCFNGEIVALSTRQEPETARLIEAADFATNHWGTCPKREEFKRR
jgi:hypothetical protein